jgi:hypothetical protein
MSIKGHSRRSQSWRTIATALLGAILLGTAWLHAVQRSGASVDDGQARAERAIMEAMSPHHMHATSHLRLTARRPERPGDRERAAAIVAMLRPALERYRDYRVAIAEGYQLFLPELPQPIYHFNNYGRGFVETFEFRPDRPASLLYRKTRDGYELVGAMYTAPPDEPEADLDARVPLSLARWHAHVNICLPQEGFAPPADWATFGPSGSINTDRACSAAGGRFYPQLFGWMVHVYPFETTVDKIWAVE